MGFDPHHPARRGRGYLLKTTIRLSLKVNILIPILFNRVEYEMRGLGTVGRH